MPLELDSFNEKNIQIRIINYQEPILLHQFQQSNEEDMAALEYQDCGNQGKQKQAIFSHRIAWLVSRILQPYQIFVYQVALEPVENRVYTRIQITISPKFNKNYQFRLLKACKNCM